MSRREWLIRACVLCTGVLAHTVAWLLREGEGGKVAELPPGFWQHAAGIGVATVIVSVIGPLLVMGPSYLFAQLKGRGRPRQWVDFSVQLGKVAIFIAIFGIWMPLEFWFYG